MEHYSLQASESVLYKNHVTYSKNRRASCELILTNLNLVITTATKKAFSKPQTEVEVFSIEEIKIYNDVPQIKAKESTVEIYLTSTEFTVDFNSMIEAQKFSNAAYKLITGKSLATRGAEKVKNAINLVDNTLGVNTVEAVKGVVEDGIAGSILGGIGKKMSKGMRGVTKGLVMSTKVTESLPETQSSKTMSYDEQIETINKMKALLDTGVLTQEEFDLKKKEILGL